MRYARVPADIWRWPVFRALAPQARLIALYLWTGPHINPLGAFTISTQEICDGTGVPIRTCQRVLAEWTLNGASVAHSWRGRGVVRAKWGLVWLPEYIERLPPANPNMWASARNILEQLEHLAPPGCRLCATIRHHFETVTPTVPTLNKYNPPPAPPLGQGERPAKDSTRAPSGRGDTSLKPRKHNRWGD